MMSQKAGRIMLRRAIRTMLQSCVILLSVALVQAQTFNSTSTGADGVLDYTGTPPDTTVIFDPATHVPPLDVDGDNIYHFTTINIPGNVTVKLTSSKLNFSPVYWLASGSVRIDGTLDLSGDDGHAGGLSATRTVSLPGPGGFPGGVGGSADSAAIIGFGPGASNYGGCYGTPATYAPNTYPPLYGNLFILPLIGGSGGAGSGAVGQFGGGGGGGGGAILIASSVAIRVNGSIRSVGGTGGASGAGTGPGGGGSGGAVRLLAPQIYGTGSVSAAGGPGGSGSAYGGGLGRLRLEAFRFDSIPALTGSYRVVTLSPEAIFLPTHGIPSVRVTTLDGEAVPINPTGSFLLPDMTINKSTPVVLAIQAKNIPLGTQVKLNIFSESGADQLLTSTPLTATTAASVAEASGTLPPGFSRCFVRATWMP